jgi:hypothetical protein
VYFEIHNTHFLILKFKAGFTWVKTAQTSAQKNVVARPFFLIMKNKYHVQACTFLGADVCSYFTHVNPALRLWDLACNIDFSDENSSMVAQFVAQELGGLKVLSSNPAGKQFWNFKSNSKFLNMFELDVMNNKYILKGMNKGSTKHPHIMEYNLPVACQKK